jgi:GntR family transcriptional regulator, rspAB operon transcriptional repressor
MTDRILQTATSGAPEFLVKRAYTTILDAIVTNDLPPGTPLSEASLSGQLGISRTPIREALKRLEHEGMVRIVPRRGAFVTDIPAEKIVELYGLREALECYAVQFVPQNGDPAELERLMAEYDESAQWLQDGEIDRINDMDLRLHRYIAGASRNQMLLKLVEELLSQVTRLRRLTPSVPGRLEKQREEHGRILHALQARDVVVAREAVRDHLRTVRDTALQMRLHV